MIYLLSDDENVTIITSKIFKAIYNTDEIPEEWLKLATTQVIRPMSHTMEVFLSIIHGYIRIKCEANLDDATREALFALNVLLPKYRDQGKSSYTLLILKKHSIGLNMTN